VRESGRPPADELLAAVWQLLEPHLQVPRNEAHVAEILDVSKAQAKVWLQRLADRGLLERNRRPAGYVVRPGRQATALYL
jgi:predicted transcriptional regulator